MNCEQFSLFDKKDDLAGGCISEYIVERIDPSKAKRYIHFHHYSHGSHNAPSPCYGLFWENRLIGVLMFATPCSENVRRSVFGPGCENSVIELHRLHILDGTPKNTESWFVAKCLKFLKRDRPQTKAVISFSDTTEGHHGTIYRACSFYQCGTTGRATFYRDKDGRLRHPRQNGVNISKQMAAEMGWVPEIRSAKNRYLYILGNSKVERRRLIKQCKLPLVKAKWEN